MIRLAFKGLLSGEQEVYCTVHSMKTIHKRVHYHVSVKEAKTELYKAMNGCTREGCGRYIDAAFRACASIMHIT